MIEDELYKQKNQNLLWQNNNIYIEIFMDQLYKFKYIYILIIYIFKYIKITKYVRLVMIYKCLFLPLKLISFPSIKWG